MSGLYGDDKAAQIGVTLTLSILVVTDIIGNTLVILIILTNKSLRSPMNYLLLNLAVADMMVGIFFSPLYIFSQFFSYPDGVAGTLLCKLVAGGWVAWIGGACSAATLVAISFERYFAVMHPYGTKYKLNVKKVKQVVAGCWVFAVVITIPCLLALDYDKEIQLCMQKWSKPWQGSAYSTLWFICFGVIPVAIMSVLYSRVIYSLWFKQHQVQGTQLAMLKSRKRVTKMVVIVSVIYAVCWLPDAIIYVLYHYDMEYNYSVDVPSICGIVLVTCNSSINPFIYTFQSNVFRRHLIELVSCRRVSKNAEHNGKERDSSNTTINSRQETRLDTRQYSRQETRLDTRPDSRQETRPDTRPDTRQEKNQNRHQTRQQPRNQNRHQTRQQTRNQIRHQTRQQTRNKQTNKQINK